MRRWEVLVLVPDRGNRIPNTEGRKGCSALKQISYSEFCIRYSVFALLIALCSLLSFPAQAAQRTVDPSEIGLLYMTPNNFTTSQAGCVVNSAKVGYFGSTASNALKIDHGRFHIFMPDDDTQWVFFPYTQFKQYEANIVGGGGSPMFVTATYQSQHRPVYFLWDLNLDPTTNQPRAAPSQWHQAMNVKDPNFIKYWVNSYVTPIAFSNTVGMLDVWMGVDEGAFNWGLYGVLDNNNQWVPMGSNGLNSWDPPFAQSNSDYLASIESFFTYMQANYPNLGIMVNLGSLADPTTFPTVFANVPGIMEENFYVNTPDALSRQRNYWLIQNTAWFGAQNWNGAPRPAILRAYVPQTTTDIRTALMMYLLMRGPNFFFAPAIAGQTLAVDPTQWMPMRQALGDPVSVYQTTQQSGQPVGYNLYWRQYQNGIVYVNWTGQSQTIKLPVGNTYYDHNGNVVSQITMPDLTGDYVTTSPTSANQILAPTFFGMHTTGTTHWPQVSFGALGKGTLVSWPYIEPTKGVFNWSALDNWVAAAQSHNVSFFYSTDGIPPWATSDATTCQETFTGSGVQACSAMVANTQDWDNFVTALANRYGSKLIYELWNEPNTNNFTGTVADMVTLATHEYNMIRSVAPGAMILAPSGTSSYMDSYFAAGGPTGIDAVTIHIYDSVPENALTLLSGMKSVMSKYGLSSKPLWNTEGSWGNPAYYGTLTEAQHVGYVARYLLLNWSGGAARTYWYAWDNSTWGTLWDATAGIHPSGVAYQQAYNWLFGATLSQSCTADANQTWTCGLTRSGTYQSLVVWNNTSQSYTPSGPYKQYRDLAGNVTPWTGGPVTIGYQPLLFETTKASPCDVNGDGTTNVVDVQQEVNMALGATNCTADINKDATCNIIDVQRVVNAALGGTCVSP